MTRHEHHPSPDHRSGDFRSRVLAALSSVGPGQVVSYGDLAAQAGHSGAARAVGAVLAANDGLAWWRVVRADGRLAPGHEPEQARRLAAEGVPVRGGKVDSAGSGRGRRRLEASQPGSAARHP